MYSKPVRLKNEQISSERFLSLLEKAESRGMSMCLQREARVYAGLWIKMQELLKAWE